MIVGRSMSGSKGGKEADTSSFSSEGEDCCDADKMLRMSEVVLQCRAYYVLSTPSSWPAVLYKEVEEVDLH